MVNSFLSHDITFRKQFYLSATYLRGYWKGSENGRVVTIACKWLLFTTIRVNLLLYQVTFWIDNDDHVMSALYKINTLGWIFIVLTHRNNAGRHVAPLGHIILVSSHPVIGKSNKWHFIVFAVTRPVLEPPIYHTWCRHRCDWYENKVWNRQHTTVSNIALHVIFAGEEMNV